MSWIPPRQPQSSGTLERCKGVARQRAEPSSCRSRSELQEQWDREGLIPRERYPSLAGHPRIEAFPALGRVERPNRADAEDGRWDLSPVDRSLADQVLSRRANARGAIWLDGVGRVLGRIDHGQEVCVRFDRLTRDWVATDHQGQELKRPRPSSSAGSGSWPWMSALSGAPTTEVQGAGVKPRVASGDNMTSRDKFDHIPATVPAQ
jgi:hypothetical protein